MAKKNTAVFGIYRDRPGIERALNVLKEAGFRSTDISVLMPENVGTKDLAPEKHTKAPEGIAAGVGSGVVLGGILGWLAGIGVIAVPGIGPFLAAGPIVSLLAGLGAVGVIGGIAGALIGLGIPEYEAKRYEGRIKSGSILLSVHADDSHWAKRAKDALELTGAEDIGSEGEKRADYAESDKPRPVHASAEDRTVGTGEYQVPGEGTTKTPPPYTGPERRRRPQVRP